MRRVVYLAAVAALGSGAVLSTAQAKQLIPRHSATITKALTGDFRSVVVRGDISNITLGTGRSAKVRAHEEWNFHQPTLTIAVSHRVLHLTIDCSDQTSVASTVVVVGAGDPANDCTDDLSLRLPANLSVRAETSSGSITSAGAKGGLRLQTDVGDVTVQDASGPDVQAASGNGTVTATRVHGDDVSLESDSGDVSARRITAGSVVLRSGNGAVSAKQIRSTVLDASSDSGDVTVSDAITRARAVLHSGEGTVGVTRVRAGSLNAHSDAGDVTVTDAAAKTLSATSGQGTITVTHATSRQLTLHDDAGDVSATDVTTRSMRASSGQGDVTAQSIRADEATVGSDAGTVTADLLDKPQAVTATSGQGDVAVTVATGRYDVDADSGQGTVRVTGLIIDTSVRQFIRAHTDAGDVTVAGD